MFTSRKRFENSIFMLLLVLLTAAFIFMSATSAAFASETVLTDKHQFNNTVAYMITTAVSFILLLGYCAFIKKKELVFILLFTSVLIINLGYAFLSSSQTLSEALLANRITYAGAVFLPLFMLIIIMDECNYRRNKLFLVILLCIDVAILLLAMSPGYSTLYYEDVSLAFINGGAVLVKTYGPLHCLYTYFLILYFSLMIFFISFAFFRKSKSSPKVALSLLVVVLGNIVVWFIEQKIHLNFEFLSVSYIITELYLLSLYSMLYISHNGHTAAVNTISGQEGEPAADEISITVLAEQMGEQIESWAAEKQLTAREMEVLKELIANKKRKDIADDLCVSENTVKKHTSNIFTKLGVTSRAEIIEMLSQLR